MNAQQYVNAIVKKIKCGRKRKNEIRKQLLADFELRASQGEKPEEIVENMGRADEVAAGFNESISDVEKKKYAREKIGLAAGIAVAAILVLATLIFRMLPKTADISESKYFSQNQVESAVKNTLELWNAEDYEAMRTNATEQMKPLLDKENMGEIRNQIAEDWGELRQTGQIYVTEVAQGSAHYAVAEVTVTYEKVSVIFRLSYDEDMRLGGLYIR